MSYKVNKVIYLLLGMVLGFFVGGGIIWWQIQKKNITEKETSITENDNSNQNVNTNLTANKLSLKEKYKSQLIKYKIPDTFIDSLKLDSTTLTLEQLIALYQNETIDTADLGKSYDNIVISKDELLFTRLVKVSGQYQGVNDSYELDSVLTDQRNSHKKDPKNIRVEFWRSPINYKGYKYSNNKLVLFGIYIYEGASLESRNNKIYLNYANTYYLIEKADDFQPLMAVKLPKTK